MCTLGISLASLQRFLTLCLLLAQKLQLLQLLLLLLAAAFGCCGQMSQLLLLLGCPHLNQCPLSLHMLSCCLRSHNALLLLLLLVTNKVRIHRSVYPLGLPHQQRLNE
jgi:hypothetical protein